MGFMPRNTITIPVGSMASPEFSQNMRWESLGILAPNSLAETITLQATEVASGGSGTWRSMQSGGIDITLATGKAVEVLVPPFPSYRLLSSTAVASNRVFDIFPRQR